MSIENIEQAYDALYKAVELQQKVMHDSFYQAYIETLYSIVNHYQISETLEAQISEADLQVLRGFFEQLESTPLSLEEKRKVTQLVLLKGSTIEPLQANHQLTPDSIGFLIVYLMEQLATSKEITILDPAVGSGNLLATALLNLGDGKIKAAGIGVDIDDILLAIADVNAQWFDLPVRLFHQDAMQPLLIEPVDMIMSDLPIGYYPIDDKAKEYKVYSQNEDHTYAHHLMMEASMSYLKDNGFAFFLLPDNFLQSGQADELKKWLHQDIYVQAILKLPETMFKNQKGQKDIVILQKKTDKTKQAEVLVANIPSLANKPQLQHFLQEFDDWKQKEFS